MRQRLCLPLVLLAILFPGHVMAAAAVYDFRVVIDVSGSMKKTDPQNLRVPALKLINGLIPSGSRAGVWIFGKYVDMAVKWGEVNDRWRQQADLGADKIHSNALLTNIESALARARVGWDKPDPGRKRRRRGARGSQHDELPVDDVHALRPGRRPPRGAHRGSSQSPFVRAPAPDRRADEAGLPRGALPAPVDLACRLVRHILSRRDSLP